MTPSCGGDLRTEHTHQDRCTERVIWAQTPTTDAKGSRNLGTEWWRPWTADRWLHHRLHMNEHCFLCDQETETIDHIIASSSYSRQVRWHILAALGTNASILKKKGRKGQLSCWNHGERARQTTNIKEVTLCASGLEAVEGEEREMLSPSLIHGNANPHAYHSHCRLVDRCWGGEFRLPFARVVVLY